MSHPPKSAPPGKDKKPKLVRDSFTIPKAEYAGIDTLKSRAMALGVGVKKSELLRAGLMALSAMGDAALRKALAAVPTLKTGRPVKEEKGAKPAAKGAAQAVTKVPAKAAAKKAPAKVPAKTPSKAPARAKKTA